MKIGLYGGSFDPIHNGHLKLANAAILELGLDKVVFIPCGKSAYTHKKQNIKDCYRVCLLNKAIENYEKIFAIDYYEMKLKNISFTFDTTKYMIKKYKNNELCLLFGLDTKDKISGFKDYQKLLDLLPIYFSGHDFMRETVYLSSSFVRCTIECNMPITGLVPKAVEEMIKYWRLYEL